MRKVLCFGNELLKNDSLAMELADELKIPGHEFVKCGFPLAEMLKCKGDVFIMDVVEHLQKTMLIKDINQLKSERLISLHDLDPALVVKLLKELGNIKNVYIIGIPAEGDKGRIKEDIAKVLKSI
jgi:Ni,Fe-hydrogenase maturation factor